MAEGILTDLNELENKLGRKTPESLLKWMRDAEDSRRSAVLDREKNNDSSFSNSLSDQIYSLKQELRQLRSADVRILRQLVAVHEGIETMRWLMEDRGPITSHGNSFTGSMSSLTEEEDEDVVIPCREVPALSSPQYLSEVSSDETAHQNLPPTHSSTHFSPSNSNVQALRSGAHEEAAESLVTCDVSTTQKRMRNITNGAQTIRNALLRCSRTRKGESSLTWSRVSGEKNSEERSAGGEKVPLDYGTQWFLGGTNDDVTQL